VKKHLLGLVHAGYEIYGNNVYLCGLYHIFQLNKIVSLIIFKGLYLAEIAICFLIVSQALLSFNVASKSSKLQRDTAFYPLHTELLEIESLNIKTVRSLTIQC
jgi:hypothetical protein